MYVYPPEPPPTKQTHFAQLQQQLQQQSHQLHQQQKQLLYLPNMEIVNSPLPVAKSGQSTSSDVISKKREGKARKHL